MSERHQSSDLVSAIGIILIFLFFVFLMMPRVSDGRGNSKIGKAKADIAVLRDAIDLFQEDCGRYPTSAEGLKALRNRPDDAPNWHGPYLQKDLVNDPWGNPYVYQCPGPDGKHGYLVESFGADGAPGGDGDNADIIDGTD
jgi:general secretion pathway protein G